MLDTTLLTKARIDGPGRSLLRLLSCLVALLAISGSAAAQLSGNYGIGGAGDPYATLESALAALAAQGVSGPVTFSIEASAGITPPTGGYVLRTATGMSATNTVTIRPKTGASVVIDGNLASATFTFDGGDYFILDGTNGAGTTRDLKVVSRATAYPAILFINGAQYNVVRNVNVIGAGTSTTTGIVKMSTSTVAGVGNSYNTIASNTIGDSAGTIRSSTGIHMLGTSTAINVGNVYRDNYVVNFLYSSTSGFGIYLQTNNQRTRISGNRITVAVKGTTTGGAEAIRHDNSTNNLEDTISHNRIWNIGSSSATSAQYGIRDYYQSTTSALYIFNNTISLVGTGGSSLYGLYLDPSYAATINIANNSIAITGTNGGTSTGVNVYISTSTAIVTLRNNIFLNTRASTSTSGANRAIYRPSTTSPLTSNNNVFSVTNDAAHAIGYSGSVISTLAGWQALGFDAASITGDPQFIDIAGGDLHISTSLATPVESAGSPVAWVGDDIDGNTRHATRPDIGADEGTFIPLPANDLRTVSITVPVNGAITGANVPFNPVAIVQNLGTATQTGVNVRFIIRNAVNAVVYEDVQTTGTISMSGQQTITFSQTGNVSGSTSLAVGVYTMEARTELASDFDVTNDAVTGSFETKAPLSGSYTINLNAATGGTNFRTFTAAFSELSQVGVSGPVTFNVQSGTYSSLETFPLVIRQFPGSGSTNTVTIRPASGASVLLEGTNATAILSLEGADYITVDGSNNGSASQDFTIRNLSSTGVALRLIDGATRNTVRNMVLQATATSTTAGIVQIGSGAAANSFNRIVSNTIGDVNGVYRSSVGVVMAGSSTALNASNYLGSNYIVNYLNGSSTGYGINVLDYNQRLRISRNRISIPVKGTTTGESAGIRWDNNEQNLQDTIDANRIWDIQSSSATSTVHGIYDYFHDAGAQFYIANNMISIVTSGAASVYGIHLWPSATDTNYITGNSIYIGGSNSGTSAGYGIYSRSAMWIYLQNNIIVNERVGSGTGNYLVYLSSGTLRSERNIMAIGGTAAIGYSSGAKATPADWQALGYDLTSEFTMPPLVDAAAGDLHVDLVRVFRGESKGLSLPVRLDFDGETRDSLRPDVGADEGNFNGGGIALQYPNGGEQMPVNFDLGVRFTASRPLPTFVDFSSDNGATWTRMATVAMAQIGANTVVIQTPDVEMTTARVRVISQLNSYEADTSDASFSLLRPVFAVRSPNGGERVVPTDTVAVSWTSQFVPPSLTVNIEYSTDNGATWTTAASDLASRNLPDTNVFNWIVPDAPGPYTLVRVMIPNSRSLDASNAPFTIESKPAIRLLTLNDGARLFAGETVAVNWTSVNTASVRLEYSPDGGATWLNLIAGNKPRLGASFGTYPWTVPAINAPNALVRVVSNERTRFADTSNLSFEIVVGRLAVLSPNGGERYELNEPITVRFDAPHSDRLRLEFSSNAGASWQLVAPSIDAAAGSYTFTPAGIPTPRALVRLVDEARLALADVSDATFEIMEARSIVVFTPSTGDQIMRSTIYPITWQSIRVNRVNIDYSPNGGAPGSWVRVATDISAAQGSFNWTAPSQNTAMGVIRISEVGGPIVGLSGEFSVITPVTSLRLLRPNGGESYTAGEEILIGWTSANVATVSLEYSSDGGASWRAIAGASSLPATQSTFRWTAPNEPGTGYRVKVNGGALNDMSDNNFTIVRRIVPSVTVLAPNGGERFVVDSTAIVTWRAVDLAGDVTVSYSVDNGDNWTVIGTAAASAGQLAWTVPAAVSEQALVKVVGTGVSDVSDAVFAIEAAVVRTLTLSSPNASTVVWKEGEDVAVTWSAQNIGDNVAVTLSTDNGATYTTVLAASVPAAAGTLTWRVPHLSDVELSTLRVKVASLDGVYTATSSESFTYRPQVAGVETRRTVTSGLTIAGAYPNPFATTTEVRWTQSFGGSMELRVYDGTGRPVRHAALGHLEPGTHAATIDAALLPAGVYHYELRSATAVARGTMTVVR